MLMSYRGAFMFSMLSNPALTTNPNLPLTLTLTLPFGFLLFIFSLSLRTCL
jgi:hypothetical protein